jgi:serine/threonine-protein kinase
MEPLPGYRLLTHLGSGAFSEVWAASTPDGGQLALKFLRCQNRATTALEIRALQAIRQIKHPRLIRIERVWGLQDYIVVGMELADCSLADLAQAYQEKQGKPIVPEHACLLMLDVAEALDFLNTRQHWIDGRCVAIQHCDVKPANLVLVGDRAKVTDFGLSAVLGSQQETRGRSGTLEYCAPEVFQGLRTSQTDQYSLAVTYCVLRGGRLPFPETPQSFDRNYVRPAPDLSMLDAEERPIIARALHTVPQSRWPSCTAMSEALLKAVSAKKKRSPSGRSRANRPVVRPEQIAEHRARLNAH